VGLLKTAAKVAVASSVHGRVQRRQQERWARQDAAAAGTAMPPAPPVDASAQTDIQQQLALVSQLIELRDAGALTEAEFEVKKAQILRL
jgi:hypothetical protein